MEGREPVCPFGERPYVRTELMDLAQPEKLRGILVDPVPPRLVNGRCVIEVFLHSQENAGLLKRFAYGIHSKRYFRGYFGIMVVLGQKKENDNFRI